MWQQVVLHQLVLEGLLQLWVMIIDQKSWNTGHQMVCWFCTVESSEIQPCKAVTEISSCQVNTTILPEINKQRGFSFGSIFLLLFHKNCRGDTFFHSLANVEFCHYWIVRG